MNKRYIYIDGKVYISDELGSTKEIDYSDNVEEILVKENLIEQMKLEYEKLKSTKNKCRGNISFKLLTKSIFSLLSIPVVLILMPLIFGTIELSALPIIGCVCAIGIPTILATFLIYQYNKINNTNNGIENQITFLEQQLSLEKENLNNLNVSKTNENELTMVSVSKRVDDIMELKRFRDQLLLFYNCGYHQNRYQKYLKQGTLRKKLKKCYPEDQLDIIEKNLESSAKVNQLRKKVS